MSEWWTYRLSDFLLFSERVYYRLFDAQSEALWPLPVAMLALGTGMAAIVLVGTGWRSALAVRAVLVALAAIWAFVALSFLRPRYAPINPIATYLAWGFFAQASLVFVAAFAPARWLSARPRSLPRFLTASILVAGGLAVVPLISRMRGETGIEWFGMAPDPTIVASLGLLALAIRPRPLLAGLSILPLASLLVSALTLRALADPLEWTLWASLVVGLATCLLPAERRRVPSKPFDRADR